MELLTGLGTQIARALNVAHAAGIIHRDIKPENVMMRDDGLVKVLDFGIARLSTAPDETDPEPADHTATGTVLGTLHYMSPEQARGEKVTNATDVFSLGVVLYELATAQHPFEADSRVGMLQAIISQSPITPSRLRPELPASLDALLLRMLEKDAPPRPAPAEVEATLIEIARANQRASERTETAPVLPLPRSPAPPVSHFPARSIVGRERERAELRAGFDSVTAGRGLVMCVAGEPGIGKTTIVEEFLTELATGGRQCRIARGRCSERLAGAEAYLPWLEALDGLIRSSESSARLMKSLAPSWHAQVAPLTAATTEAERRMPEAMAASQERMKRELAGFLGEISRPQPLVLYFDDLHWADVSTVDLLAFLAARFDSVRVLLIVTYRPSDMMLAKHPFLQIKPDLQTRGLCRELRLEFLTQVEVENYLELEFPLHRFPPEFPKLIHAKTEGNPLFMADLVRYLRARNVLAEQEGEWTLAQSVPEIERELPESVRGMIERKIAQLSEEERRLLVAAGVQGAQFDSAVVAKVIGASAAEVEERLETLERVYAFVQLIGERELPNRVLTLRYRFVHVFYQNTLYGSLRPTRKVELSLAVAQALLDCYGERSREAASELAALFEAARDFARAAEYYRLAAENAVRVFASREAVVLARRGLAALASLPETRERGELEFALQIVLGNILIATRGYGSPDVEEAYSRARHLCQQLGETTNLLPVLYGLYVNQLARADYRKALAFGQEFLSLAERLEAPAVIVGCRTVGVPLFFMAGLDEARRKFERGISIYDAAQHRPLTWFYGGEPGMVCHNYLAWTLWLQGYPDQALEQSREAIRLGREVTQAQSQAQALAASALLHQYRRETQQTLELAEAAITLASEQGLALWLGWGTILRGWAMTEQGQTAEGIERIRRGIEGTRATGAGMWQTYLLCLLAEAHGKAGQADEGLAALAEVPGLIEKSEERYWEAEVQRTRGELLKLHGASASEIEACFHQAIGIARRQGAKSLELRAATSLARLQGKHEAARRMLAEIYGWFTEGFDTPDLKEAQTLLEALS
jgi:predicted ATPase